MASDCTMVKLNGDGQVEATRSTHHDKVYTMVALISHPPFIATVRPGAIGVGKANTSRQAKSEAVAVKIDHSMIRTKVLRTGKADPATLDISEAEMVVAGGRGIGGADNWYLVEDLAQALGASVGGTRMAMDEGWLPRERLIGQTGKTTSPRLYIGLGISGAKEHVLGLREVKNFVAINKDPGAPILKVAGKAVVGDVKEIVPILVRKLKENGEQTGETQGGPGTVQAGAAQ
jgi:electron transfer flavoprotein alpha subunit